MFQVGNTTFGEAFACAWDLFTSPAKAIQAVMPIPIDATPVDLATAYRTAVGEQSPATVIARFWEPLQSTAELAIGELQRRIASLPESDQSAGLILAKDFGTRPLFILEHPQDEAFRGPSTKIVSVAPLRWLPANHFLRSLFPDDQCWQSEDGPCLILGPVIAGTAHAKPFYLLETVQKYTAGYRSFQVAREQRHEASLRRQAEMDRQAREANPLYRASRLEAENAQLRERLEALEQKIGQ